MKRSGIYKIVNTTNGKYYVGSSCNIKQRWDDHKIRLQHNRHSNEHLQNSWNKYGKEQFTLVIVEDVSRENLLLIEQKYLDIAKNNDICYNIKFVAEGGGCSEEGRLKIIEANRRRKGSNHSIETRHKISKSMTGKHLTLDSKIKCGESSKKNWKFNPQYQQRNSTSGRFMPIT